MSRDPRTAEQQMTRALGFALGCAGAALVVIAIGAWSIGQAIVEALK
jgi:hypothetical protein